MCFRLPFFLLIVFAGLCSAPANDSVNVLASTTTEQIRSFWFAGAEISRFELSQSRYGAQHAGQAVFIFVTEPFDLDEQVKSDTGGTGTTPVLKLNALRTFNTGIYSYRTMLSTFTPTRDLAAPQVIKETLSVQDWCGQVFTQINRTEDRWQLQSFSESAGPNHSPGLK